MQNAVFNFRKAKVATQAIFLVCGFGVSSWAPMVPFAKERLGLNDGNLGLLLLFLGAGSIILMPITGLLILKIGTRSVMMYSVILIAITLPLLLIMKTWLGMGFTLFMFGSGIGAIDVAMNAHGVQIQNLYDKPIMSSLHGLFSVGGLFGSLGIGFLIKIGLVPVIGAIGISILLLIIVFTQRKFLMDAQIEKEVIQKYSNINSPKEGKKNFWLNRRILFLGAMCFAVFLSEGAMLDWSALFLRENKGIDIAISGIGYASFSLAMATMRLFGDRIVSKIEGNRVVIYGGIIGATGLVIAIFTPWLMTALIGFVLLGVGAANMVPVFFSEGGKVKNVSSSVAIPAITTLGFTGQLAGPALLGFIAHLFSLPIALGFTAILLLFVSFAYWVKEYKKSR